MNRAETMLLVMNEPEVFLILEDMHWLKRLWSGGDAGSGSLCLTEFRLVFLNSTPSQRLGNSGPKPGTVQEMNQVLKSRRGQEIELASIRTMRITKQGIGKYGYGQTEISELSLEWGEPARLLRLRFAGIQTAGSVLIRLQQFQSQSHRPPQSPIANELAALGIPDDFGLPVNPESAAYVVWLRSTIAFAFRTLTNHQWELAISDANKLIGDHRLATDHQFALILAAAYCVRGMAHEGAGRKDAARADYRTAQQIFPSYALASTRLASLPE